MHGLARVELHDVTDPMGQRDGVHRLLGEVGRQRAVEILGPFDRLGVAVAESGLGHDLGHVVAETDAETLPLDGEHPVPLQIAERAVVGDQFEAVVGALEGAAGSMAAIAPITDIGRQQARRVRRG